MNRPALGNFPSTTWAEQINSGLLAVKPKWADQLFTMMCGSCANEGAFKAAFFAYRARERGSNLDFSEAEITSCMNNAEPGSPHLSILSFKGGFHGRLFGSLSTTRSKPIHKVRRRCRSDTDRADRHSGIRLAGGRVPEASVPARGEQGGQRRRGEARARGGQADDQGLAQQGAGRGRHRRGASALCQLD